LAELYNRVIAERAAQGNTESVIITDNSSSSASSSTPANDAVTEMNQRMQDFNSQNSWESGSSSSTNSPLSTFNRYNVLDKLKENEGPFSRPGSPSSSIDSSETIRPYNPNNRIKGLFGRNNR